MFLSPSVCPVFYLMCPVQPVPRVSVSAGLMNQEQKESVISSLALPLNRGSLDIDLLPSREFLAATKHQTAKQTGLAPRNIQLLQNIAFYNTKYAKETLVQSHNFLET